MYDVKTIGDVAPEAPTAASTGAVAVKAALIALLGGVVIGGLGTWAWMKGWRP